MKKLIILKLFLVIYIFCFLNNHAFSQLMGWWNSTDGNNIYNVNNGKVGIGDFSHTTPSWQLHVLGDIGNSNGLHWNNGRSHLNTDQGGSIELGDGYGHIEGGNKDIWVPDVPYIDFHWGAYNTGQDYNTRIMNSDNNQLDFVTSSGTTMRLNNAYGLNYNNTLQFFNNGTTGNLAIEFWSFGSNNMNTKFEKKIHSGLNKNGINSYNNMIDFYADYKNNSSYDQFSIKSDGRCSWANDGSWFSNDQNGAIRLNAAGWFTNNNNLTPYIDFAHGTSGGQDFAHFSTRLICNSDNSLDFITGYNNGTKVMSIINDGVFAKKITVQSSWSDFVFKKDYHLLSLTELEKYVKENKHLPDLPSEQEVNEKGIELGEMASKLTQKIEELTLYVIDLNKEIEKLKKENGELREKLK